MEVDHNLQWSKEYTYSSDNGDILGVVATAFSEAKAEYDRIKEAATAIGYEVSYGIIHLDKAIELWICATNRLQSEKETTGDTNNT